MVETGAPSPLAPPGRRECAVIQRDVLQDLIDILAGGYEVLGPTLRDGAIVYGGVRSLADLPAGWTDHQEPGRYRLDRRADAALFGFAVGPHSWKQFLHPPVETLWTAHMKSGILSIDADEPPVPKFAFLGVRACELRAISIQDRVFLSGPYKDAAYARRRENCCIVAVNCGQAGGTCFCVSMQAGPKAETGYDLALTELLDEARHEFLVETGSEKGGALLQRLASRAPAEADFAAAEAVIARTRNGMGRRLETENLKEALQTSPAHPRWDDVAARCLACGNCTMVCPTCFCTTVEDHSDLSGGTATRVRKADSCFTLDFSFLHGGSVRQSGGARYRQWMTHKLASWIDQYGSPGCVGCGRCITWCPVGIDLTEEAGAIRAAPERAKETPHEGA